MNFFNQRPACPFPAALVAAVTNEKQKDQHQQHQQPEKVEHATSMPTATTTACTTPSLSCSGRDDFPITHIEFETACQDSHSNLSSKQDSSKHQHQQHQQHYQFHPTGPLMPPLNYYDNDYGMEPQEQQENHHHDDEAQSESESPPKPFLHPRSEPIQVPSSHLQDDAIQRRGTTYNYCPKPGTKEGSLEYSYDRCPSPRTVLLEQDDDDDEVLAQEQELKSRREYNRATWRMYHRITNHRTQSQLHYHHEESKNSSGFETASPKMVKEEPVWGLQDGEHETHENDVMIDSDRYRRDRSPSDEFIFTMEL